MQKTRSSWPWGHFSIIHDGTCKGVADKKDNAEPRAPETTRSSSKDKRHGLTCQSLWSIRLPDLPPLTLWHVRFSDRDIHRGAIVQVKWWRWRRFLRPCRFITATILSGLTFLESFQKGTKSPVPPPPLELIANHGVTFHGAATVPWEQLVQLSVGWWFVRSLLFPLSVPILPSFIHTLPPSPLPVVLLILHASSSHFRGSPLHSVFALLSLSAQQR